MARGRAEIAEFYSSAAWREARVAALLRYGHQCRACGDRVGPFDVDHIQPVAAFWAGRLMLANLQVLCRPCHRRKHARAA